MKKNTNRGERVALYARISEDDLGLEAGVARQLQDARTLAQQRGWTVVMELQDNDISAANGKHRPGYQDLIGAAEAGRFDRIIAYHTSRMWRNRVERAQGIDLLRSAGVSLTTVKGPELDLSTAAGRGMAGLLGEFDTMESEIKSERVTRAALQRAESGAPNGAIPFGWTRDYDYTPKGEKVPGSGRDVLHPDEAPIVAEVCRRLLAGETMLAVTAWLNETGFPAPGADFKLRGRGRGIQNPTGARWGKTSVKKLALRPANAGLRMYHAGRPDQRLLAARIEPIVTRDEWERLVAMHGPNGSKTSRPGGRVHLLTWGVGECGVCGSVLRVAQLGHAVYGTKKPLYSCDAKGCVGRNEANVDAFVTAELVSRLQRADARDLLVDNEAADRAMSRATALRARLDAATDDYAEGFIAREQLLKITSKLRPQIAEADREAVNAAPAVPLELLAQVAGKETAKRFDALTVAQKRTLVEFMIEKVVVMPTRRGPGFREEDVQIVFRGQWLAA
jgi:site-specific DNA recombinase